MLGRASRGVAAYETYIISLDLGRDIKIGEQGLTHGFNEGISPVEQELDKVENVLPGHDARRDISSGKRIITNGLRNGIQVADPELRKFDGTGLRKELEGNG
ncbi:hypothetical protein N7G274_002088 [Stereocaulon virgatum]|uniref:Uncharacterized protein n=1 Tax=Stereocaulon virgatum TaxID=373712 RepID=A0ABR4AIQ2_9LECA